MAVTNRNGKKLDLDAIRAKLIQDRDSGKVSKRDYNQAMKGLNKVSDAEMKGVNYEFTGDRRFRTVSGSGNEPTANEMGIGANTKIPVFGKKVSKGLGYAQSIGLTVPEETQEAPKQSSDTVPVYTGHLKFNPTLSFGDAKSDVRAEGSKIKRSIGPVQERDPETFAQDAQKWLDLNRENANKLTEEIWKVEQELQKLRGDHNERINDPWNVNFGEDFSINPKKLLTTQGTDLGINWGSKKEFAEKELELIQKRAKLDGDLKAIEGGKYARPHVEERYQRFMDGKDKIQKLKVTGGPFMPDGWMPVAAISTIAGGAWKAVAGSLKGLPLPALRLNAPAKAASEIAEQTVRSTANRLGAPATSSVTRQLGYTPRPKMLNSPTVRLQLPAPTPSPTRPHLGATNILPPTRINGWQVKNWKFAKGGKVKILFGGGKGFKAIEDQLSTLGTNASNQVSTVRDIRKVDPISTPFSMSKLSRGLNLAKPTLTVPASVKGISDGKPVGDRRTTDVQTRIPKAFNEKGFQIDKDSAINNAMGLYGAASLLTSKRPKLQAPKDLNLFIRPAQGDEDMVSRSNQAIDESVRMGSGMLRTRTGSDLSSYVQGTTAMIDNAGKAKASVLGQNAQLKRADEGRMAGEINTQKQINWQSGEQFRQEQNFDAQNRYASRVGGAQAALNNALNFGVQKRADLKNKAVERSMMNKRYGMSMLSLAEALETQGLPQDQIIKKLEQYKALSFEKGGSLSDATKMQIESGKSIQKANTELRKLFSEYSKLISKASIQNIQEFNRNIRALNNRKNLTIYSR